MSLIVILVLSGILFWIKTERALSFDLFELNKYYYIERLDHFSEYRLVMNIGKKNKLISNSVETIFKTNDGVFFINMDQNFLKIEPKSSEYTMVDKLPIDIEIFKPWQFVETKILSSNSRTIRLITQIIIIFYIVNIALKLTQKVIAR